MLGRLLVRKATRTEETKGKGFYWEAYSLNACPVNFPSLKNKKPAPCDAGLQFAYCNRISYSSATRQVTNNRLATASAIDPNFVGKVRVVCIESGHSFFHPGKPEIGHAKTTNGE